MGLLGVALYFNVVRGWLVGVSIGLVGVVEASVVGAFRIVYW